MDMDKPAKREVSKVSALIIYVIVFYGIWTGWELWAKPLIDNSVQNKIFLQVLKSGIIKNLVWTLPAVLLIKHYECDVHIELKKMFTEKVNFLKYLPVFLIFTVYLLGGAFLQKGKISVSETFGADKLITVLFVGITEETVFRGWLLNAAFDEKKKWLCVIVNSLMFLLIHFPVWIHDGVFIENFRNFGFLGIIILGIIFGWTFIKSKSIWVPISLHMYWDLMMFLFY